MEWVFWLSLAGVVYAYAGYPLWLSVVARLRNRTVAEADNTPRVSIILAVFNEESVIGRKLDNLLALDYPRKQLDIIVVSDHSTDRTDAIVSGYKDRGVELITMPHRSGKHYAQKTGISHARGDILAFTDAAPILDQQALRKMMRYFADSDVGAVSSEDRVMHESGTTGEERSYIGYLMGLRRLETLVGSVVGLSGSFFAVRRGLCEHWWVDRSSDFFLALEAVRRRCRAVHHPESIHYYSASRSPLEEFQRKRRTVLNGLIVFFNSIDLLNPFRYGWFSLQLVSHKLCRWLVPVLLVLMLVSSAVLARESMFFEIALAAGVASLVAAALGLLIPPLGRLGPLRLVSFVTLSNAAILLAWLDLARGQTSAIWNPTRRREETNQP